MQCMYGFSKFKPRPVARQGSLPDDAFVHNSMPIILTYIVRANATPYADTKNRQISP